MSETTETTPTPTMLRECAICASKLIGGTAVALVERGTAPGRILYACTPCVRRRNILPLDEQDAPYSDGRLRFRGRPPQPDGDAPVCP